MSYPVPPAVGYRHAPAAIFPPKFIAPPVRAHAPRIVPVSVPVHVPVHNPIHVPVHVAPVRLHHHHSHPVRNHHVSVIHTSDGIGCSGRGNPVGMAMIITGLAMVALGFMGIVGGSASLNPGLVAGGLFMLYPGIAVLGLGSLINRL